MLAYYLFMALLIATLVLWAVAAFRSDTPRNDGSDAHDEDGAKER